MLSQYCSIIFAQRSNVGPSSTNAYQLLLLSTSFYQFRKYRICCPFLCIQANSSTFRLNFETTRTKENDFGQITTTFYFTFDKLYSTAANRFRNISTSSTLVNYIPYTPVTSSFSLFEQNLSICYTFLSNQHLIHQSCLI